MTFKSSSGAWFPGNGLTSKIVIGHVFAEDPQLRAAAGCRSWILERLWRRRRRTCRRGPTAVRKQLQLELPSKRERLQFTTLRCVPFNTERRWPNETQTQNPLRIFGSSSINRGEFLIAIAADGASRSLSPDAKKLSRGEQALRPSKPQHSYATPGSEARESFFVPDCEGDPVAGPSSVWLRMRTNGLLAGYYCASTVWTQQPVLLGQMAIRFCPRHVRRGHGHYHAAAIRSSQRHWPHGLDSEDSSSVTSYALSTDRNASLLGNCYCAPES